MKKIIIVLVFIGAIFGIIHVANIKNNKTQTMDQLVKDMTSVESLKEDAKQQVKIHKAYIKQLQILKSNIKKIESQTNEKIILAQNFGKIGDEYIRNKLLPVALEIYNMGLDVFSQDEYLIYKKGLIMSYYAKYFPKEQEKYYQQAEDLYKQAVNLNSTYAEPHYSLALLYFLAYQEKRQQGSLKLALEEVNTYISLFSTRVDSYFLKGQIAYALGDRDSAQNAYLAVLNMTPVSSAQYKNAKQNLNQLMGL